MILDMRELLSVDQVQLSPQFFLCQERHRMARLCWPHPFIRCHCFDHVRSVNPKNAKELFFWFSWLDVNGVRSLALSSRSRMSRGGKQWNHESLEECRFNIICHYLLIMFWPAKNCLTPFRCFHIVIEWWSVRKTICYWTFSMIETSFGNKDFF